jgi:collagenase-like PrtC family protease
MLSLGIQALKIAGRFEQQGWIKEKVRAGRASTGGEALSL